MGNIKCEEISREKTIGIEKKKLLVQIKPEFEFGRRCSA